MDIKQLVIDDFIKWVCLAITLENSKSNYKNIVKYRNIINRLKEWGINSTLKELKQVIEDNRKIFTYDLTRLSPPEALVVNKPTITRLASQMILHIL